MAAVSRLIVVWRRGRVVPEVDVPFRVSSVAGPARLQFAWTTW